MLNKPTCISLLFLLLMQVGGLQLIYKMQQCFVQQQMEQVLSNDKTVFETLIISSADFEKQKITSHEILLNGKMYDIKSIKLTGGKVELQVVNDSSEERVIDHIKTLTRTTHSKNKEQGVSLFQLFGLLYICPGNSPAIALQPHFQQCYFSFCEIIISHAKSVFSPPPELV